MVEFIHEQRDVNDLIIVGDLNSALQEDKIRMFFTRIGVSDVFSHVNNHTGDRDPTFIRGKEVIDTVAMSGGCNRLCRRL